MVAKSTRIIRGLAAIWRRRPLLTSFFAIAVVLTVLFGLKALVFYSRLDPARTPHIAPWMSPNYISRVWHVDPETIRVSIGLDADAPINAPIARIAREQGRSPSEIVEIVQELILEQQVKPPQ